MALRAEFHSGLTHAKLDYPPFVADGDAGTLLKFDYRMGADKMGTFTVEVPADCAAAANAIAGRELWFYDGDYVVFKGVIRTREYAVNANGVTVLTLVGPSITDQLNGTHTGRGLQFESSTLTAGITTLLTGTDFDPGDIDTATIPAREYNDRYIFDAVLATAQAVDCSVRENLLTATPTIDVGVFGESSGITLRNLPESSPSLLDNDYMKQIGSIKVKAQSLDIRNRITPWGQIEGIGGLQFNLARVYPNNPDLTTRLYLSSTDGAVIYPAYDSGWEATSDITTASTATTDRGSASITGKQVFNTGTNDRLKSQFIYGPLGTQTLGGNVTGQFIASESDAGTNATLQMLIKVVSPDGLTVRGTALAHGTYGNEANTTDRNLTFPSTALTAVDVQAGDYLVIELGWRKGGAGTATFYIGNNGTTDLPVDETTTDTTMNPWIEFSQFISLGTELPSEASFEILSQTRNGRLEYYIEDADSIAQYGVREASPIFKDIFPLGLTNLDFGLASTTLYGMAVQYLQKHTQEQVAYEVEVLGLRHVNPNNGAAFFRPGDTFRLQFDGWTQNADGSKTDYLTVDRDLYILDFTVTYDSAGVPMVKVTLSTFLRAERSDSEIIKQMAKDIGIANVSPLTAITIGNGAMRLDETSIQLRTGGADTVTIYGLEELSPTPSTESWIWKIFGRVNQGLGISTLELASRTTRVVVAGGTDPSVYLEVDGDTAIALLNDQGYGDGRGNHAWLPPISGLSLAHLATTISGGAISIITQYAAVDPSYRPAGGFLVVDTEAAGATDNLDNIYYSGTSTADLRNGQLIVVTAANSARSVVLTESGNLKLGGGTMTLDNVEDSITLVWSTVAAGWIEIARSNNGA